MWLSAAACAASSSANRQAACGVRAILCCEARKRARHAATKVESATVKPTIGPWPGLLGAPATRALLERVLHLSEADETEVALDTETAALTRFAHNVIHQNVAEVEASLEVRVVYARRVGAA